MEEYFHLLFFMDFIMLNVQGLYKIGIKNKDFL